MPACLTPFYKRDKIKGVWLAFPCGQCYNCKMRRVNGWAFRLDQEFQVADSAHFLTITYDTQYVPINDNLQLTLRKHDLQKLFKRIRKWRDAELVKSDWTQVIDAPVDQAVWAIYRQSLRDLPASNDDPRKIDLPVAP